MDPQPKAERALGSPGDPKLSDLNIEALIRDLEKKDPTYLRRFVIANPNPYTVAGFASSQAVPPPIAMEEDSRPPARTGPSPKAISGPSAQTGPSAQPILVKEPRSKTSSGPSAPLEILKRVKEPHSETSPASSESDDFCVVQTKSQKRKLKASKSQANAPKKVIIAVPSTSSRSVNRSQAAPEEESEDSPMNGPPKEKVPPLYIREKLSWQRILPMIDEQGVKFEAARSTVIGIRVDCPTSDDHRRLTKILRQENVGFHTYALPDEKVYRAVIRGLPRELSTDAIKADLDAQGFPVLEVHRMYHPRTKIAYEMVLVVLSNTPEGKRINTIRAVCRLSGLRVEPPNSRGRMGQCHRCQLYGHSARNCYAHPRCVKCLGDHGTSDCPRTQPTEEPPSCVLCRTQGHPANYRGCPKAPKEQRRRVKTAGRKPNAPPKPAQTYVPAPPPATNAWDKPLTRASAPAPQAAHVAAAPAAKPAPPSQPSQPGSASPRPESTAANRAAANFEIVRLILNSIDLEEMEAFTQACCDNLLTAMQVHMGLLVRIDELQKTIRNGRLN